MKDKAGQDIFTGDFFVMAVRRGDTASMKWGRVIDSHEDLVGRIQIQTVDESWGKPKLCRKTRIEVVGGPNHERLLVVPNHQLPTHIRHLFSD
jgi:hypothetical protein